MTLHIFNPSHDEALAADTAAYLGSKAARTMECDLYQLPLLWADQGDSCWQKEQNVEWEKVTQIAPWGWNKALVYQLQKTGAPSYLLPSEDALAAIRRLSHRRTAMQLLAALHSAQSDAEREGVTTFCETMEEVKNSLATLHKDGKEGLFKAPWSCSGRGVFHEKANNAIARIQRIIKQQGGIMLEAVWEKEKDFAMLFDYEAGRLIYRGISLVATDEKGAYKGNIIDTQDALLARLTGEDEHLLSTLNALRHLIESKIPSLLGSHYEGPLGIDMMCNKSRVHPCVEINLRRTMGRVALDIAAKQGCKNIVFPTLFALEYRDMRMRYTINALL